MSNGKGDSPRPLSVDGNTFANNWDRIFGKKNDMCEYSNLPSVNSYDDVLLTLTQLQQELGLYDDTPTRSEDHT